MKSKEESRKDLSIPEQAKPKELTKTVDVATRKSVRRVEKEEEKEELHVEVSLLLSLN